MAGEGPNGAPPSGTPAEVANARVVAVQEAADAVLSDGQVYAASTRDGEVHICQVTTGTEEGVSWVDVRLHGDTVGGDPHFRIFNPPMLAADPAGPIEINGVRYREDPMAAVAQVIAAQGGATASRGRRKP
jgi:hypothetical protein